MHVVRQKQRHVRQRVAHGDWFDVGDPLRAGIVGNEDTILAGGEVEVLLQDFVPDDLVDPAGIAPRRREQIDYKGVNTCPEKINGLLDEITHRGATLLVSR
jgi:hypothetical protein